MNNKFLTKRPMIFSSFRMKLSDVELLRTAAARAEISQSEFLREAIREKARSVLLKSGKMTWSDAEKDRPAAEKLTKRKIHKDQ